MTTKMTKKNSSVFYIFIIFILTFNCLYADDNWVIAASKFGINKTAISISDSLITMIPSAILENLGTSLTRSVTPEEASLQNTYDYQTERLSLYLQLSSAYKTRDALVLQNYSKKELKKKIKEQNEKILEIEKKISDSIEEEKEALLTARKNQNLVDEGDYREEKLLTEGQKWLYLFKNLFVKNNNLIEEKTISLYNNNSATLYAPDSNYLEEGIESYNFQKQVVSAKINCLLMGNISSYGDYISVQVDAWLFPGAKKIASVMEVGSVKEIDFLTSALANKLLPYITNALPVKLELDINPKDAENLKFYMDDVLQNLDMKDFLIQSGSHTLQFQADNYKTAYATYNFEGNRIYKIEVNLSPLNEAFMYLQLKQPLQANLFSNGESAAKIDDSISRIKIDGNTVLGQLVDLEGNSQTFYIPPSLVGENKTVMLKIKKHNEKDYIDKRRKWMYGAYSSLMISLMPKFFCYGQYAEAVGMYGVNSSEENLQNALKWQKANTAATCLSVGCGIFFGYELVRYLLAANSVLPQKVQKSKFVYSEEEPVSAAENIEDKSENAGEESGENKDINNYENIEE